MANLLSRYWGRLTGKPRTTYTSGRANLELQVVGLGVQISWDATAPSGLGVTLQALLDPGQARELADALTSLAGDAEQNWEV